MIADDIAGPEALTAVMGGAGESGALGCGLACWAALKERQYGNTAAGIVEAAERVSRLTPQGLTHVLLVEAPRMGLAAQA